MMNLKTFDESTLCGPHRPKLHDAGRFLTEYTAWLWGCGATTMRIEKNAHRIATALDCDIDITIMPRHVTLAVRSLTSGEIMLFNEKIRPCGINFAINTELSALSWSISDRKVDFRGAKAKFREIVGKSYPNNLQICLLASLANASFCRLFGGDAYAMATVFIGTFAGFMLKHLLLKHHIDNRVVFFLCALITTIFCAGASNLAWSDTPGIAIATGVLYLIPGVPYINAANDMMDRRYLCAFSRFMDAVVLTITLSAGLCAGLLIMQTSAIW